jgi:glycosyltransferase involved in cell wall biosynthesis
MIIDTEDPRITLFGHPFTTIGRGESLRAGVRSLNAVSLPLRVHDIFRSNPRSDPVHHKLIVDLEADFIPEGGIRIFYLNGDEVDQALEAIAQRNIRFDVGYNIIFPTWELPRYPQAWAPAIRRFDQVWAISQFNLGIFREAGFRAVHIGESAEIDKIPILPRRYFGIRESAFTFLCFFDTTSYVSRKNPSAAIKLFSEVCKRRPFDDLQLIIKVKDGDRSAGDVRSLVGDEVPPDAVLIPDPLSTEEIHSLIAVCDCLVSLHRSEGFGRGGAEAMFLRKLCLATAWSGNLDYMTSQNSLLVNFVLVPVGPGEYPDWEDQVWAEPDVDHACHLALKVIDDPAFADLVAATGRRDVIRTASHRAVGVRMLDALGSVRA